MAHYGLTYEMSAIFCATICTDTEVASDVENAGDKELKSVFGRNLYDTDCTNSILKIMLFPYCPVIDPG